MSTAGSAPHVRNRRDLALAVVPSLRGYQRSWLSRDVMGGLTAGAVVIPQAMAYATIAGLPVEVGLYTCMVPMAVYALLGGSRTLSVSTTSTIAVLTGSTLLSASIASESDHPERDLAMLTLLVGLILLLARLVRAGSVIDNISEATLVGIKIGVGLTVAASQLPKLLGIPGDPTADNFFSNMDAVVDQLDDVSWATIALSAGALVLLLVLKHFAPRVPGPLIAVAGGILLVAIADIDEHGVAVIAAVPSGLPEPVLPAFDHAGGLLPGAFAIAIMVILESLAVARAVRRATEPSIDNDQELIANGMACTIGALFRAMPSAGGFSQTAINQGAGARTQLSELVTVVLAVLCALFLGDVLSDLPQAILGCLVMVAVIGLIKPAEIMRFWRLSKIEFWVVAVTAVSGLVFGLLVAVLVGVLLTLFLLILEIDRLGVVELRPTPHYTDLRLVGDGTEPVPGMLILRFEGPLYTANIRSVAAKIIDAVDARDGIRVLVLDGSAVPVTPLTVVNEMIELERELDQRNVELWFAATAPRSLELVARLPRWEELNNAGRVYDTSLAAVRAYAARHPEPADGSPRTRPDPSG